jgi:hypothetical protein
MLHPDAGRRRFFELTVEEWFVLVLATVFGVALLAAVRPDVTLWPALGLGFTALVVGHLCLTVRRFVAFPDLIVAAACLQWIVAPWLAETYPPRFFLFRMALPPDEYLSYAVPATIALWLGLHLPVSRRTSVNWPLVEAAPLARPVRRMLDAAIVLGLAVETFGEDVPGQWAFLVYLLASCRFVGALGWMVTRTPGWQLRVAAVLIHLAAIQSSGGLFYLVVHWGGYFLLVYAFMRRWRWKMAAALGVGLVGLSLLQTVKPNFRSSLTTEQVSGPVEAFTRLTSMLWEQALAGNIVDPNVDPGDLLVRFNQGWIVARVMKHVPAEVPYANGETLTDALAFSIIPRFLVPSKRDGTSRELFSRYTGVYLTSSTRMGLGIIGEMYANFGRWGAIAAVFVYGYAMGWLFLFFADRARKNLLWWAAASIILLPGVEPGFNLEDIANHVVKAAVLFGVLWKTVPPLRRLLALPPEPHAYDDEAQAPFDRMSPAVDTGGR